MIGVGIVSTPNQGISEILGQDTVQIDSRITTAQKATTAFQIDQ